MNNLRRKFLSLFLPLSLIWIQAVAFADEKFPFLAEVSSPSVNIRAGQHLNFEKLCRLNKGVEVVVVAKSYSWYKIKLPAEAKSFISQNYIQLINDQTGSVTANRVNVRAGPDPNTTALGQVKKGTTVKILEKLPGWYRIEPVDGTYGWVSDQYLKFKSNTIPAVWFDRLTIPRTIPSEVEGLVNQTAAVPAPPAALPSAPPAKPISEIKESVVTEKVQIPSPANPIFVSGIVAVLEDPKTAGEIHHKLIIGNQTAYYLEGGKKVMDEFISYQVMVEGRLKEDPQHFYLYPVIVVSRINLVL